MYKCFIFMYAHRLSVQSQILIVYVFIRPYCYHGYQFYLYIEKIVVNLLGLVPLGRNAYIDIPAYSGGFNMYNVRK